jgi:uncharacterized protein YjiS (DUF1127 family)
MHPTYGCLPTHHDTQFGASRTRAWASIVWTWFERSRQRRALAELDDRLLDDIGLTRSKVQREAAKPFWCAGKP